MTTDTSDTKTPVSTAAADRIDIVYYTDPLCCWSWAMEEGWQQFITSYADQVQVRYCMGGLIPDWNSYYDDINSINRPVQMGPLWMEVRHRTGVSLNDRIWMTDPPASSYPACIAVKAAELQGAHFGQTLLQRLREAVMHEGRNIAKTPVLLEVANGLPEEFDQAKFQGDLLGTSGMENFRHDLNEVKLRQVTRFPTIIMSTGGKAIKLTGYRTSEVLEAALLKLAGA
jgi:putative protein-disulfide isomerase